MTPGTRLGPYEVIGLAGSGGMGEVYRARDTRLDRTVAIKVLPAHLSSSPEWRQRFEREARTISRLSHPHICALYDVGREGEIDFLVMEYLEGETLADRLSKGPLSTEDVLRYGVDVAGALDKAHRQGIVHRDLKPGNLMITKSGVKLLDFGLAKAIAPAGGSEALLTALPTRAESALTQEGMILGTLQYMAREQLTQPRWRGDGRELFYVSRDRKVMSVDVRTGAELQTGAPRALFQTRILPTVEARNHYDVSSDGQRFIVNSRRPEDASLPIHVVVGWAPEKGK